MKKCSASPILIQKEDKCSLAQGLRNDLEQKKMEAILYASVVVASIMKDEFVACFEATIQAN